MATTLPSGISPCADAVRAAAGDMEATEIQEIFQLLRGRTQEILAREGAYSTEQAAMRAADELARQAEHAAIIERRNALLNVRARAQLSALCATPLLTVPTLALSLSWLGQTLRERGLASPLRQNRRRSAMRTLAGC